MSKDRQNLPGKATPAPARPSYWSFYNNEWTETNSDSDDFFNGDYCEDGTFTAKLEARNARSRINIEAKARHLINVYERVEQNQLSEAINLYLDLPQGRAMWLKLKAKQFRLHIDNGEVDYNKLGKVIFYSALSSNLSDYNSAFKVGAMLRQPDLTVDTRFKTNIEKAGNSFFLYNKFEYTWKKISLRILSALDANVWMLQKNNIEAVYKCNADNELTMSLKVDDFRTSPASLSNFSSYFESLSLDYIRKMNQTLTLGAKVQCKFKKSMEFDNFQLALSKKLGHDRLLKFKINSRFDTSFLFRSPIPYLDGVKFSFGAHIIKAINSFKVSNGIALEFNTDK